MIFFWLVTLLIKSRVNQHLFVVQGMLGLDSGPSVR